MSVATNQYHKGIQFSNQVQNNYLFLPSAIQLLFLHKENNKFVDSNLIIKESMLCCVCLPMSIESLPTEIFIKFHSIISLSI